MNDLMSLLTPLVAGSVTALALAAGWRLLLDLVADRDR